MSNTLYPGTMLTLEAAHKKWLDILELAETTVESDAKLQKGARSIPTRTLPPEVLGRNYARYCDLINKMYDAYLNSVQLQRAPYILDLVTVFVKRMFELRNELVHLIVNDYVYVDAALQHLQMTPFDIQIVVPYHFPLECRSENVEQALQKMWADAVRRRKIKERESNRPAEAAAHSSSSQQNVQQETIYEEADLDSLPPSEHSFIPEHFVQALLIQRHERFRQWYKIDYEKKSCRHKQYFAKIVKFPSEELKAKAARLVQVVYREYMKIKREREREARRDVLLGITPDPFMRRRNFKEENDKVYARRKETRTRMKLSYLAAMEKENIHLIIFKKDGVIEDITDEIRNWFTEWYYGYGFFPDYPYEAEGGTLLVVKGDYPTIEEKVEMDAKYAAAIKGKTPDQLKDEKMQEKEAAKQKAAALKETEKKEALNYFKARCNPESDPGYKPQESALVQQMLDALRSYRASWSIYDDLPPMKFGETIYGFMKPLITESLMMTMHKDCRMYVDELMRLDLKLLIKIQQAMFKEAGIKYPKFKPRKKPKLHPLPKTFVVDQKVLKHCEKIFDLGIVTKPTEKISDIYGDSRYANYEYNVRDPDAQFPLPGYGDIKQRLMQSCVYGVGIQHAPRRKAIMLLGPERNGKSFLVDTVAGELNAVKIDITPEVFSAVLKTPPGKEIHNVYLTARAFQPAVIFLKNIERVFAKKVPEEEKHLRAASIKEALKKMVKNIPHDDKIIFIATCTNPWIAQKNPLVKLFDEIILVPRTDYGTLQQFYLEKLLSIRSVPRDICVNPLAQLAQGFGFGVIMDAFNDLMSSERIVRLNIEPITNEEIFDALVATGVEPSSLEDYQQYVDFFIQNSPLKAEREEYDIINYNRADCYLKLAKKKLQEEAKNKE